MERDHEEETVKVNPDVEIAPDSGVATETPQTGTAATATPAGTAPPTR